MLAFLFLKVTSWKKKTMPAVRGPAVFFRSHRMRTGRLALPPHHESNRNARGSASTSASVVAVVTEPASPARPRAAADAPPRQRHSSLPEPETRVRQSLGPREPADRVAVGPYSDVTRPPHLPVYIPASRTPTQPSRPTRTTFHARAEKTGWEREPKKKKKEVRGGGRRPGGRNVKRGRTHVVGK